MTTKIHQEVNIEASAATVFDTLTQASRFSKMSGGAPAEIDATAGGAFSCFGAMIEGRNIELVKNERLVQAWRAANWEPGVYSIVSFQLRPAGSGTLVVLDHSAFPDGQAEHLAKGWHANYWEPLAKLVAAS